MLDKLKQHRFLFEELVKRDFKKKYKRTALGMFWSILSPLLTCLVMKIIFSQFFERSMAHYTIYLLAGNIIYSFFLESTNAGMQSLMGNAYIFSKIKIPKYIFLLSKNVQTLINFLLTVIVFFGFTLADQIQLTWKIVLLIYPIVMLLVFNLGVGLILSALFVFFKDIQYLWNVFTRLLMYLSAIFYSIDQYPLQAQQLFFLNPLYLFILYFRQVVIHGETPSLLIHGLIMFYSLLVTGIGALIYRKYDHKFLYYI